MKGVISVILMLVVAMYQEILSCREQGFIGLLRRNQKSLFKYKGVRVGHVISNLAEGLGQSFLCRREGVGHAFLSTTFPNAPAHRPPILFDQSLKTFHSFYAPRLDLSL